MAAAAAAVAASTQRPLALLVYGATGFTGKYVCEYLAKTALTSSSMPWGIAGRNKLKLEELVRSLEAKGLSPPSLLLLADNRDPASLEAAAAQTRLLLNCTGPYRFLGEEVIKACLRSRTDCIDLCGEPEFMDRMLLLYHEEAKEKKVLLLSACAFDSVPADLGTIFAQRVFLSRGGAALSSVESFLSISTGGKGLHGHATTFEAAVHGFGSIRDLLNVRRELKRKYPYNDSRTVGPPLKARNGPYFESRMSRYAFKFPGSDASVVKASQRSLVLSGLVPSASSLPRYAAYFTVPSLWWAAVVTVFGSVFAVLAQRSWGRSLLLSHPSLFTLGAFTHEGPTEEQLAATRFSMTFIATGYHSSSSSVSTSSSAAEGREGGREGGSTPDRTERGDGKKAAASTTTPLLPAAPCDKILITRVTGPEPGYVATPIIFVELARCLLAQRPSLPPSLQGGVYTPGAIFYSQPEMLFERLEKAGVRFEVVGDT